MVESEGGRGEKVGGMGRDGGGMEWCGLKEGGVAELTHLSLSLPMSSSSPMSLLSPMSSSLPMSVHGCWPSFVSRSGCFGWWWFANFAVCGPW